MSQRTSGTSILVESVSFRLVSLQNKKIMIGSTLWTPENLGTEAGGQREWDWSPESCTTVRRVPVPTSLLIDDLLPWTGSDGQGPPSSTDRHENRTLPKLRSSEDCFEPTNLLFTSLLDVRCGTERDWESRRTRSKRVYSPTSVRLKGGRTSVRRLKSKDIGHQNTSIFRVFLLPATRPSEASIWKKSVPVTCE